MKASALFLRTAVIAVLVSMSLGIWMGLTHDFTLSAAHAHLNLIGWVSMFLFGLYYRLTPVADTRRAMVQYWLATTGLVLFNGTLAINLLYGITLIVGILWIIGAVCTVVSMLIFAWSVFSHTALRRDMASGHASPQSSAVEIRS